MFEYSKNSVEMLKFLSFTVYFLHFDDFFNQMCLKFSAFNKTANINFFKILLKCLKMTRWSFAVSLLHFHEFWTKYFWIFQHSTFSKWCTYIKIFEFYNFLLYSLEFSQFISIQGTQHELFFVDTAGQDNCFHEFLSARKGQLARSSDRFLLLIKSLIKSNYPKATPTHSEPPNHPS